MIVTDLSKHFCPVPKKQDRKQQDSNRKSGQMKKKSKKLAKLERQRDKDLIKSGTCGYCGKFCKRLDPHEVFRRK